MSREEVRELMQSVENDTGVMDDEKALSKEGRVHSRRDFLKGMVAAGFGAAMLATGTQSVRAGPYGAFTAGDLSDEKLVDIYRTMLIMRHWELKNKDEGLNGNIGYVGHLYAGMEASAAGVSAALRNKGDENFIDITTATHRGHGATLAKGADITAAFKEQLMKADGLDRGYGGSMHLADRSIGMFGVNSIIGGNVIISIGVANGIAIRGTDQVSVAFIGDGASQSPYLGCALNTAKTRNLPFILVIENNGYQIAARHENISATKDLADLALGYGIPRFVVDGQDVLAVYDVTKRAVERARGGGGPTVIETKCYRYFDHSGLSGTQFGELGAWNLGYRSNRELQHWLSRDPVNLHRRTLVRWEVLTDEQAEEIEAQVVRDINEAFDVAFASPEQRLDEALETAYASGLVMPATHWYDWNTQV